jgi:hypothetical protein
MPQRILDVMVEEDNRALPGDVEHRDAEARFKNRNAKTSLTLRAAKPAEFNAIQHEILRELRVCPRGICILLV